MSVDVKKLKEVFALATAAPDQAARADIVERECGSNADLRREVLALLAAHDRPPDILERPLACALDSSAAQEAASRGLERAPATAGANDFAGVVVGDKYRLLEKIGEGGMGAVYRAEQLHPVVRQVAVKLIKDALASAQVLGRFEAERHALALMEHPNIAKVFDAGTTGGPGTSSTGETRGPPPGAPYFVMELVHGVPITQFCDDHRLTVSDRLALFRLVCHAMQHAHQKGIIHRDLKPTNILVESHDGAPAPKIIDFGMSKAIGGGAFAHQAPFTALGFVAGTPLYMAPEQARFDAVDIDTRADIYALGVVLYELLTGATPIERATLQKVALDEVLRAIREQEPPPPSQRISSSDALPSLAATRRIEPTRLGRYVRGELDWIVMKALAKERDRRYESANALAEDVERFQHHEPVLAGPPTRLYRLRKFVRRNRGLTVAATLLLATLSAGIAGTSLGLIRANQARDAEALQKQKVVEALERVEQERQTTKAVNDFLQNDLLGKADIAKQEGDIERNPQISVRELLDRAAAKIDRRFGDRPLVEAAIRQVIGSAYAALGEQARGKIHLQRAAKLRHELQGDRHGESLGADHAMARVLDDLGEYDAAERLLQRVVAGRAETLGADHPETLESRSLLASVYLGQGKYAEARALYEEVLAKRLVVIGPDASDTLAVKGNLARVYESMGLRRDSERMYLEYIEAASRRLGPDHPNIVATENNLASLYLNQGRFEEARKLFERVLDVRHSKMPLDHPDSLTTRSNLGNVYFLLGDAAKAMAMLKETLEVARKKLSPDHPTALLAMHNLGNVYRAARQLELAEALYLEAIERGARLRGPSHPYTLGYRHSLAMLYRDRGQIDKSLALLEEVVRELAKTGPLLKETLTAKHDLAVVLRAAQKLDRAEATFIEVMAEQEKALSKDHPDALASKLNLAAIYYVQGKHKKAEPLIREMLDATRRTMGPTHWRTQFALQAMLTCYQSMKRFDLSEPFARELLASVEAKDGADSSKAASTGLILGWNIHMTGKPKEAESVLRRSLAIFEKTEPRQWNAYKTQSMVGETLLAQKKYAEAAPLLLAGFEGMKATAGNAKGEDRRGYLLGAVDRLIRSAQVQGKHDDVKRWQAERQRLAPAARPAAKQRNGAKDQRGAELGKSNGSGKSGGEQRPQTPQ